MNGDDALAGLDAVNWAGLTHAYGPAGDVPRLIRAPASAEPDEHARVEPAGTHADCRAHAGLTGFRQMSLF